MYAAHAIQIKQYGRDVATAVDLTKSPRPTKCSSPPKFSPVKNKKKRIKKTNVEQCPGGSGCGGVTCALDHGKAMDFGERMRRDKEIEKIKTAKEKALAKVKKTVKMVRRLKSSLEKV